MRAYPAAYRQDREAEIIATLLDAAPPGRSRPTLADTTDVVAAGLRARLGGLRDGDVGLGLRTAAPVALAMAAGMAVLGLVRDSESTAAHPSPFRPALLVYVAWLLAVAGRIVLPGAVARVLSGVALLGTLAALAALPWTWASPSPGWSLALLALLGCVAIAGGGGRASVRERGLLAAGAVGSVAILGGAALVVPNQSGYTWFGSGGALADYPSPVEAVAAFVVALLLVGMALLGRYRDRRWRVAALTLLVAAGWLLVPSPSGGGDRLMLSLAIVVGIACAIGVLRRTETSQAPAVAPGITAVLALGCAAGLAAAALLAQPDPVYACFDGPGGPASSCQELQRWISQGRPAYLAWLVALVAWAVLPRRVARVLVAVAVVATPAVLWPDQWHHPAPDNVMPLTLSVLGIVTLLSPAGPVRRAERWGAVAVAVGAVVLPVILVPVLYLGFFSPIGPWFTFAFVPLTVALATGWRAARRAPGPGGALGAATVALSAAWMVVLAFQVSRYPVVAALLATAAVLAALLWLRPTPRPALGEPIHQT
jgi:hypothetical protein